MVDLQPTRSISPSPWISWSPSTVFKQVVWRSYQSWYILANKNTSVFHQLHQVVWLSVAPFTISKRRASIECFKDFDDKGWIAHQLHVLFTSSRRVKIYLIWNDLKIRSPYFVQDMLDKAHHHSKNDLQIRHFQIGYSSRFFAFQISPQSLCSAPEANHHGFSTAKRTCWRKKKHILRLWTNYWYILMDHLYQFILIILLLISLSLRFYIISSKSHHPKIILS